MSSTSLVLTVIMTFPLVLVSNELHGEQCESGIQFGHNVLQHFSLDDSLINVNFGSFGSAPLVVQHNQSNYRQLVQNCPDCWFRIEELPHFNRVQQDIAKYVGVENWMDVVFIPNASNGCNTILRSIALYLQKQRKSVSGSFASKYKLLYFSTAYEMVVQVLNFIVHFFGDCIEIVQFNVTDEMFSDQSILLAELEQFLIHSNSDHSIYACIFSHISSTPAVLFNAADITALLHRYDIVSIVDGAHSIGQIPLNLAEMDCDFYVTNCHKWLMAPHGSAIMFVKKRYQSMMYPLQVNNGAPSFGNRYFGSIDTSEYTQFQRQFIYTGTNDQTAYLAVAAALQFRAMISNHTDHLIMQYCHDLAIAAADLLVNLWRTSRLISNDDNVASMVNVVLPTQNETKIKYIRKVLFHPQHKQLRRKYAFMQAFQWNQVFYVRVSAQIYNELSDFEWFGQRVLETLLEEP